MKRNDINDLIENDNITYRIIRFLPNSDVVNFMITSKKIYKKVVANKGIYKNLMKSSNKE